MIAMKRNCLDRDELELALCGRMEPDAFDAAISHLDDCDQCRSAAESFQQQGQWMVESLAGNPDPLQAETACQVALWQVLESPDFSVSHSSDASPVPQEMLGPYRLIRALGSGGMATVFLAEHVRLKRKCAIKILPRERVDQPGWLERFDREMTTVAALEHANVVRATDAGHQDGLHYLVMEHVDGLDVGRVVQGVGRLEVADACEIVRQAALGLAHIHAAGLVHRDVKPSNMMLTRDGGVKLLDLGLVLSGDDPLSVDDRLTTVGHLMGTMPYMAPEQLLDSRDVDARADLYSLGATLFRLIAGRPPHHRHGGLAKHVMAITRQDAPPLDSVREDVDKEVVALVAALVSRDPQSRPSSVQEVAERLAPFGENAQLKRLLRQAARRGSEPNSASTAFPLTQMESGGGRRPLTARALWQMAVMALVMLAAGFVFKIATDRGDLVIKSPRPGVITVSRGEEMVERLEIEAGSDNRVTLRKGTYIIAIEGDADGLTLSEDTVTIGRGTEAKVALTSRSADRVYQGKSLDEWMTLLTREEDPRSLGEIMTAVEVLSRESDQRLPAAIATLRSARLWGGYSSSAPRVSESGRRSGEPSQNYMYFLNDVFHRYGADGLVAISGELDQGNDKSRIASIWMLKNLLYQHEEFPTDLADHLLQAVTALGESTEKYADSAAETGKGLAITLLLKQQRPIVGISVLEERVRDDISRAEKEWQQPNMIGSGGFRSREPWVLDESLLAAAVEMQDAGALKLDWKFVAQSLFHEHYQRYSERTDRVMQAAVDHDSQAVDQAITARIKKMTSDSISYGGGSGGGRGGMGMSLGARDSFYSGHVWVPAFYLLMDDSIWPKALMIYAKRTSDARGSLEVLKQARKVIIQSGADMEHKDNPFRWLETAITMLEIKAAHTP